MLEGKYPRSRFDTRKLESLYISIIYEQKYIIQNYTCVRGTSAREIVRCMYRLHSEI